MPYQLDCIQVANLNVSAQLIASSPLVSLLKEMPGLLLIKIASTKIPASELFPYQTPPNQ